MSIRPVKRVVASKPTLEGAGVKLRRAFGFGNTTDFDPFLLFDDFRNDSPDDYLAGLPVASASRHRDDHLRARRHRRARRQPRQSRQPRRGRRPVDDGGQRHPAPGDAEGRSAGPHARLPALGEPARVAEDDGAALSGRRTARTSPRSSTTTARACASCAASFWGKTRAGGRRRGRPALPRHLRAARRAQAAAGRDDAPRVRVRLRGLGHVPRRVGAARGARPTASASRRRRRADDVGNRSLVLFDRGDEVVVQAGDEGIRFLLVSGKPIEEPVAWYGPIVMNTRHELQRAIDELNRGTFIK